MPDDSNAGRMLRLFEGNEGASGTHGEPEWWADKNKWGIKPTAVTLRTAVTEQLWEQHLAGTRPLGVVPIRNDSSCVWASIDFDEYDADLPALVRRVDELNLPLVPVRSKSGGLHLFLFMAQPQPAELVIACLRDVAARVGVAGSEIFPKQGHVLAERGDIGNWMCMPYLGTTYGGKLANQAGLTVDGQDMSIGAFLDLAESSRLWGKEFEELARRRPAASTNGSGKGHVHLGGTAFSDGPPCLQHLAAMGVQPGGQNNTLLMMGIYYKQKDPENWKALLEQANNTYLQPPGSHEGLAMTIASLEKKEYNYTCKKDPMASHCDSVLCMTRKFGVGDGGNFPRISGISKLNTEPPIWFVDIDDQRVELGTDELQNYMRFHKVAMDKLNRSYGLMKQSSWMQMLNGAMRNLFIIDAPADVGAGETFRELLEEFLTNRTRGQSKEDILTGRPWEDVDEKRHYFRMGDLIKHLQREGMREVTRPRVGQRLKALGGSSTFFNIKGHGTNVWFVPVDVIHKTPEIDPPKLREMPI